MSESNLDPVRLGFVGAGTHARSLLYPCLHFLPGLRLCAIATRTPESAALAERDFRVPCHVGYEKLLADPQLEAVVISVPGQIAAELSAAALEAGKHVLCETPAICSPADAARVGRALARSDRVYQVAYCLRYASIYKKLKALLEEWRTEGGGAFCLDIRYFQWIHHFYNLALYLAGPVKEVRAWSRGPNRRVVLEFANGDLGTVRSTALHNQSTPYEEVEITRADGMLRAVDRLELRQYRERAELSNRELHFDLSGSQSWRYATSMPYNRMNSLYASGYAGELEAFAQCVRTGGAPVSSLEDAALTEELGRSVEEALQRQGEVR
jgi:predicted dehydrogenase